MAVMYITQCMNTTGSTGFGLDFRNIQEERFNACAMSVLPEEMIPDVISLYDSS